MFVRTYGSCSKVSMLLYSSALSAGSNLPGEPIFVARVKEDGMAYK